MFANLLKTYAWIVWSEDYKQRRYDKQGELYRRLNKYWKPLNRGVNATKAPPYHRRAATNVGNFPDSAERTLGNASITGAERSGVSSTSARRLVWDSSPRFSDVGTARCAPILANDTLSSSFFFFFSLHRSISNTLLLFPIFSWIHFGVQLFRVSKTGGVVFFYLKWIPTAALQ